ncbi:T9SS C-terminal target domain-containing protein [candidate division KSB1 bacterium]|nr:MAG: T9SS C-terminal target domain-containing protein [candidate division KSB1 bacterium]MBC6948783.1 T9SS C-terminal target domain-containing protein [candidate division KSB1 bacterium]MCE7941560.1 T9SS C-terminal target domain-containing protein [Chlorobi bacterium CHB1]MDL1875516.1 T9SS type A sorting domain-containing protein [Cytophagia bacterium CHB2]
MKKNDSRQLLCSGRLHAPIRRIFLVFVFGATLLPGTGQAQPRFISHIGDTEVSYCLACSPDGKNVYAGGLYTIVVFARQADGSLVTRQVLNNDHQGVAQIGRIVDMVVAPDGRYVYAIRGADQTLLLFTRDLATGEILLKDAIKDSAFFSRYGDVPAVERNYRLLLSPDGAHLFWLYSPLWHYPDNRLAVFRRNKQTGYLERIQTIKNGDPALGGFNIPSSIAVSPNSKDIYGCGYNDNVVMWISQEISSGRLQLMKTYKTPPLSTGAWFNSSIIVSPDSQSVYATYADSYDYDKVFIFHRDRYTGDLDFFQSISHPTPSTVLLSPDGKNLYIEIWGGRFAIYARSTQSAELKFMEMFEESHGGRSPSGIIMSPDGNNIILVGGQVLARDEMSGKLVSQQIFDNNLGGTDRLGRSRSVETSPDGRFLYVAARIEDAGISTFARDQDQGTLTLTRSDSLPDVSAMIMAPDGRHLYVSSVKKNTISALAIDQAVGGLLPVQTLHDTLNQNVYLEWGGTMAFSPDGLHLYFNDGTNLRVYQRDPLTGTISPVQKLPGQEYGLHELISLAVSPDGRHLYWNNFTNGRPQVIATFERNTQTGELSFGSKVTLNGEYTYPWGAMAIKVAPDGRHVYATTGDFEADYDGEPRILIFNRDAITGELTSQQSVLITGWSETRGLEISSDGLKVYALVSGEGYGAGLLAFFDRDAATGELTLRERFQSWKEGVYGMFSPRDLSLSPDGRFIYIADVNGVATFATGRSNTTSVTENHISRTFPAAYSLSQNYPNPFNPSTTIGFDLPQAGRVKLAVYNLRGELVSLLANGNFATGSHRVKFDASGLASGVYFYRLEGEGFVATRKLALVR